MAYPERFIVNVGNSPTLVFSGVGKVQLQNVGPGAVFYGDASIATSGPALAGEAFEFSAPCELYAIRSGVTPGDVVVWRWF